MSTLTWSARRATSPPRASRLVVNPWAVRCVEFSIFSDIWVVENHKTRYGSHMSHGSTQG